MLFKIANVKVSCKVKHLPLDIVKNRLETFGVVNCYNNYLVLKAKYTYIIFKTKDKGFPINHINITKIPNTSLVKEAVSDIENILGCETFDLVIDNITGSAKLDKKIDLIQITKEKKFEKIKYNNQKFPGLFLKLERGTAIIFHSGKIVIVGCRKEEDIECILQAILAHI